MSLNKYMENYTIIPVDENMKLRVESLNILNEFKILGFTTKSGFAGVVQNNIPEFKDYHKIKYVLNFWDGRYHKEHFNKQLAQLLEKLKTE